MRNSIFTFFYSLCTVFLVFTYVQVEAYEMLSNNQIFQEDSDENSEEIDFEEELIDIFHLVDKDNFYSHFDKLDSPNDFYYSFTVKSNFIALSVPPPRDLFV